MHVCLSFAREQGTQKMKSHTYDHNMRNVWLLMCAMKAHGLNTHQNAILTVY
jgi:hypothetical protein